ncbi:hypothetical protein [uncultured Tateyamaria sp.]|uniref:hypothetical protein n=1 Tax=uncultured Tateyamaria sp. TaxID=455651 RepID=UPI0026161C09|nr:hypothetical protein [uncultured Tateyamaria sp.]
MSDDSLFGGWRDDFLSGVEDDPETENLEDSDGSDFLSGGGDDDVVVSGDGADTIVGGSWISDGHAIDIIDFDVEYDSILLVYADGSDIPDITLEANPTNPAEMQVFMGGIVVANVLDGSEITIEDIPIMPLSLAQFVGMASR